MIRRHSEVGAAIIEPMRFPEPIDELIRHHHERLDGSGYPRGLTGDQVGVETRTLQLADVIESMSSHRPYRPALGVEKALAENRAGEWAALRPRRRQSVRARDASQRVLVPEGIWRRRSDGWLRLHV